ncbi:MAG: Cif family virulence factor, partial [Planctomycetota bacterium]
SVRAADLVVLAEPTRFRQPSARVQFRVTDTYKGKSKGHEIVVDLTKSPFGLWPKIGDKTILCLSKPRSGKTYHLATYFASVLPPNSADAVRKAVARELPPPVARPVDPAKPAPVDAAARALAQQVAASDTILLGRLSDVREAGAAEFLATFKVEDALLGYGGYGSPVTVRIRGKAPEAGKHLLYLRGATKDGRLVIASTKWGVVPVADAAAEEKLKGAVRAAVGERKAVLTTIQATIAEWQDAWNKRDLARCIRCYSRQNTLRKHYEGGEEGRKQLVKQVRSFPGTVELSLQRISLTRTAGGAAKAADVTVLLKLVESGPDSQAREDRRAATMSFVLEDGEWLILKEGF